jgi:2-polyprenyl-6-methoxyphenol hydroxylase-like FAD-dependent oxidoreductase
MSSNPSAASPTTQPDCDILIVGAGLVGASLALRLAESGLRIGLLDRGTLTAAAAKPQNSGGSGFDPRVVALTA